MAIVSFLVKKDAGRNLLVDITTVRRFVILVIVRLVAIVLKLFQRVHAVPKH